MSSARAQPSNTRTVIGLALLVAVCAAVNLTKPVQVDDAAYLVIANWVAGHPLHPMLGLLNWADSAQPIWVLNQPLLYVYLQALLQVVVGPSLLAQHALMAVVSAGVVVALTAALGLWLAGSDYAFASVYPQYAASLAAELPPGGGQWTVGHWGWQWYAGQAGLVAYDRAHSVLAVGDSLVVPELVHQQTLRAEDEQRLMLVGTVTVPATPLTWLRTMSAEPWGGYYYFSIMAGSLPWTWSTAPVETFWVYRLQ